MKSLKIASIIVLAVFALSFMVSGVSAAQDTTNGKFHIKTVKLNEIFTVEVTGTYHPTIKFNATYNSNYLTLISKEGRDFTFKAIKPGITYIKLFYIPPWYPINVTATAKQSSPQLLPPGPILYPATDIYMVIITP